MEILEENYCKKIKINTISNKFQIINRKTIYGNK